MMATNSTNYWKICVLLFLIISSLVIHQVVFSKDSFKLSSFTPCKVHSPDKLLNALKFVLSLDNRQKKYYSQNAEDGVTEALLEYIEPNSKYYVEFGTQSGVECNTRFLREKKTGWRGLLMDGGFENAAINLHKEFIRHDNIVQLFEKYAVPKEMDLLSVDTDFKDYWILKAILQSNYRPRIIISEVNTFLGWEKSISVPHNSTQDRWDGYSQYFGYSLAAGFKLGREYGYSLIYCERIGVNCWFIIDGKEGFGEGFRISDYIKPQHIFRPNKLSHKFDKQNRPYVNV
jgi:hypothetical protein